MQAVTARQLKEYCSRQFSRVLEQGHTGDFLLAYSGGLDSSVLLKLVTGLADSPENIRIRAMHVDHGLNPGASRWAAFCARICTGYGIDLEIRDIAQAQVRSNREASYRQARYRVLGQALGTGVLLTAHHQRDQAETVLFNLFRGAGIKGLGAMQPFRKFKQGYQFRPLLDVPYPVLREYAQIHKLEWIEDPSNTDTGFDRNYIRHRILPVMTARWPSVMETIGRSASHMRHAAGILAETADQDLDQCETGRYPGVIRDACLSVLDCTQLKRLSDSHRANALKHWMERHGGHTPGVTHLDQLCRLSRQQACTGLFKYCGIQIRRYRNFLYAMRELPQIPDSIRPLARPGNKIVFESLQLVLNGIPKTAGRFEFRLRRGGEKIRVNGHLHEAKKIFQEQHIPPWERQRLPFMYQDDELIAIAGLVTADDHPPSHGRVGFTL